MKKVLLLMGVAIVLGVASGCTTYQERIIDEGTVVEERMIVE